MSVSTSQASLFTADVLPSTFLQDCITWIQANLRPDQVFSEDQLNEWAGAGCNPDAVFSEEILRAWARGRTVEFLCGVDCLERWAEQHGYVRAAVAEPKTLPSGKERE